MSSDQKKLDLSTSMKLTVGLNKSSKIQVFAELDFRKEPERSKLTMAFNNLEISENAVKSAKLDSNGTLNIIGERLDGEIVITAKELELEKNIVNNVFVSAMLGRIKNTSMTIFLKGKLKYRF